jgi:hypothetical protein
MKTRRALLKSGVLAVSAAVAGGAAWLESKPAQAAGIWNTSLVKVRGSVSGSPESVSFSGDAKVSTRLAPDPDFGAHGLVLSIDLTGVSGVGSSTRAKYVIGGPEIVQKRLAASYTVDITFPFYQSGTDGTSGARSGAASFTVDVDLATGAVRSASGSIGSSTL